MPPRLLPACHFGDNSGSHVHDEPGWSVEKGQQVHPGGLVPGGRVFPEDLHARLVFLQNDHEMYKLIVLGNAMNKTR